MILYLIFLVTLGLPIVVMEFAVGRASQRSTALSFHLLEPKGTKWHWFKYATIAGNYLLIIFPACFSFGVEPDSDPNLHCVISVRNTK